MSARRRRWQMSTRARYRGAGFKRVGRRAGVSGERGGRAGAFFLARCYWVEREREGEREREKERARETERETSAGERERELDRELEREREICHRLRCLAPRPSRLHLLRHTTYRGTQRVRLQTQCKTLRGARTARTIIAQTRRPRRCARSSSRELVIGKAQYRWPNAPATIFAAPCENGR